MLRTVFIGNVTINAAGSGNRLLTDRSEFGVLRGLLLLQLAHAQFQWLLLGLPQQLPVLSCWDLVVFNSVRLLLPLRYLLSGLVLLPQLLLQVLHLQ